MILEKIFYYTGGISLILLSIALISGLVYWFWNKWLFSFRFCWRVSFIAFQMIYGGKGVLYENMTDKDGTEFKLVEIKKEAEKQGGNR